MTRKRHTNTTTTRFYPPSTFTFSPSISAQYARTQFNTIALYKNLDQHQFDAYRARVFISHTHPNTCRRPRRRPSHMPHRRHTNIPDSALLVAPLCIIIWSSNRTYTYTISIYVHKQTRRRHPSRELHTRMAPEWARGRKRARAASTHTITSMAKYTHTHTQKADKLKIEALASRNRLCTHVCYAVCC